MDVVIFGGQSNMQGQTESLPENNKFVKNAFEYKFLTNKAAPLIHPVGEDLGKDLLLGAHEKKGSLIPDFCKTYIEKTGKRVMAVHAARGSTVIADWQKGSKLYSCAVNKINSAVKLVKDREKIDKIYYIWLQGESDSLARTKGKEYFEKLIKFKNDLKKDCSIDKFCIIKVGYFSRDIKYDKIIMDAQEQAVLYDKDFIMLTRICVDLSRDNRFLNTFVAGHYNNKGMKTIGKDAAVQLALYDNSCRKIF